jgi:NAD(P)-dependent dehydrogenase (short-subunit alcohol dehydrogenase family)
VSAAVDVALAWVDRIDVVVNNAGVGLGGFLESVTTSQLKRLFEVNLFGVHRVMRAVLPAMHAAGKGLIINVSSIMGRIVIPFSGAYTASKFALEGLSESWRYELSNVGVEVIVVEPGGFPTAFRENMDTGADADRLTAYGSLAGLPDKMWKDYAANMSAGDAPNPQAVADAVGELIRMPLGQRPFRTVVDVLMNGGGAMDINRTSDESQRRLLEGMSVAHLAEVKDETS